MAPILISEPTVQQLRAILARSPEARPEHAIRLYISGLSESGPEWSLSLDTYSPDADECCDFDGLRVIIERGLLEAVGGIRVEYEAMPADDGSDDGGFLIEGLDPDFQALGTAPAEEGGNPGPADAMAEFYGRNQGPSDSGQQRTVLYQ